MNQQPLELLNQANINSKKIETKEERNTAETKSIKKCTPAKKQIIKNSPEK